MHLVKLLSEVGGGGSSRDQYEFDMRVTAPDILLLLWINGFGFVTALQVAQWALILVRRDGA